MTQQTSTASFTAQSRTFVANPESQCIGKHVYETRAQAKRAVNSHRAKFGPIGCYRCPHCGHLHLGHTQSGRRSKKGRRPATK